MAASFTIAARNNGFTAAEVKDATSGVGAGLPGGDGRVRPDGHDGPLVRPHVRGRPDLGDGQAGRRAGRKTGQGQGCQGGKDAKSGKVRRARARNPSSRPRRRPSGPRRRPCARRTPGTACRRCPSSVSWSTASTGSSASRRWWCRSGSGRRSTTCRRTRSTKSLRTLFREYRATLQDDRRHLLEKFEVIDVARKVVGVGSVGTRAFIVLLQGRDENDPLFLQVKEATSSVLEDHLPKSKFHNPGERVVRGQRMMQAASDIYLGWSKGIQANRLLLLAAAAGHEDVRDGRDDAAVRAQLLRRAVRLDPGPRACPVRRSDRDGRLPRAPATSSTSRSPTSRRATPIRTSKDYLAFTAAVRRAGSRPFRASDDDDHGPQCAAPCTAGRALHDRIHRRTGTGRLPGRRVPGQQLQRRDHARAGRSRRSAASSGCWIWW